MVYYLDHVMNKVLKLVIFAMCLWSVGSLYGRQNYTEGYIVNHDGDTIPGYIDYRGWEKNPKNIDFKSQLESKAVKYNPSDLMSFGVEGEEYLSVIAQVEKSERELGLLGYSKELKLEKDTLFLQTIFKGEKSLFSYVDDNGYPNFYIKRGEEIELLLFKKYIKASNNGEAVSLDRRYLGQLVLYFDSDPFFKKKIYNTDYKLYSLTRLFNAYYKRQGIESNLKRDSDEVELEIKLLGGGTTTNLNFKGQAYEYLVEPEYGWSHSLSAGVSFNLSLPKNMRRFLLVNSLMYTHYDVSGEYLDFTNESDYTRYETRFRYNYLKMHNLLRYRYPVGDMYVFVNAGISNGIAFGVVNRRINTRKLYRPEEITEHEGVTDARRYEQGLVLGAGVEINKFSLQARYEKGNGMSNYLQLGSHTTQISFLLGYRL